MAADLGDDYELKSISVDIDISELSEEEPRSLQVLIDDVHGTRECTTQSNMLACRFRT